MVDVVAAVGKIESANQVVDVLNFISPARVSDDPLFSDILARLQKVFICFLWRAGDFCADLCARHSHILSIFRRIAA